ncbi:hypothetical protein [Rickettsia endosymbiont of Orchestes rusci]|uniref:hypothetical protein n=1 Tax=Rickettsia endosymbiont of Orchestes rusci TaxID=3066250 RepID=UPI00313C4F77
MSKQRLQQLEAQYNACVLQQEQARNNSQNIINEANQLKSQLNSVTNSNSSAKSTLNSYSSNLTTIQNTNSKITKDITAERSILNKLTSLLSQYNEYVPPKINQSNLNENSLNVEQAGEIADFIERANN